MKKKYIFLVIFGVLFINSLIVAQNSKKEVTVVLKEEGVDDQTVLINNFDLDDYEVGDVIRIDKIKSSPNVDPTALVAPNQNGKTPLNEIKDTFTSKGGTKQVIKEAKPKPTSKFEPSGDYPIKVIKKKKSFRLFKKRNKKVRLNKKRHSRCYSF